MWSLLALAVCQLAADPPTARVQFINPSACEREAFVRFTMPWPRGAHRSLDQLSVGGRPADSVTLERWPDGSVALALVHAEVLLEAEAGVELEVLPRAPRAEAGEAGAAASLFGDHLPFVGELVDPYGRLFVATLGPDPAGSVIAELSSDLCVVRRFRGLHLRSEAGVTTALLPLAAWTVEWPAARRAELTVVLDNDPRVGEPVLGPLRFRSFAIRCDDPAIRALPRFRRDSGLPPAEILAGGGFRQPLLGPSAGLYLGDRARKAFRFDVFLDGPDEGPDVDAALRERARLAVEEPIEARPAPDWVRWTRAFGLHGGPAGVAAIEAEALAAARPDGGGLQGGGVFGALDDPRDAAAAGMQRLVPFRFDDLLRRSRPGDALQRLEWQAMQQTLRPTPATVARLPEATAGLRVGLSRRAIARPQGYSAGGYETFSADLLHGAFQWTGDPLTRHELARLGSAIPSLLAGLPFRTSRGEGAVLRAGVRIALATGDRRLLDFLHARFTDVIAVELAGGPPGRAHAIAQPPHAHALGPEHPFDAPWQMGLLVDGLCALWRATDDPAVRDAALLVAERMAGPCWIPGRGLAAFVSARDPSVFALPAGPREGNDALAAAAFALAADAAAGDARERFRARAATSIAQLGSARRDPLVDSWLRQALALLPDPPAEDGDGGGR